MVHVFIVNENTFKYHLEYMFAGTGAGNVPTRFLFEDTELHTQDEKRSVGMINDVLRITPGDKIIFFVTGISKFYGVFEAETGIFVDPNDEENFLYDNLCKKLTYRILIKPYIVYKNGLDEFDYLDSLEGINHPDEMCWSLIYRKLAGKRGCTMITDSEYELFLRRISVSNDILHFDNYSFDSNSKDIIKSNLHFDYKGRQVDVIDNLKHNLYNRFSSGRAFEHYLQFLTIYILKSDHYTDIVPNATIINWIGNEVVCSVGEHRIDVLTIQETDNVVEISVIELKDETLNEWINYQLESYVKWVKFYISPFYIRQNKDIIINPIVIAAPVGINARSSTKERILSAENNIINYSWENYNDNKTMVTTTKIIHFNNIDNNIVL